MYPEGVDLSKSETSSAFQKNQTDMEFFSNFSDHPQFQKLVERSKKDIDKNDKIGRLRYKFSHYKEYKKAIKLAEKGDAKKM